MAETQKAPYRFEDYGVKSPTCGVWFGKLMGNFFADMEIAHGNGMDNDALREMVNKANSHDTLADELQRTRTALEGLLGALSTLPMADPETWHTVKEARAVLSKVPK